MIATVTGEEAVPEAKDGYFLEGTNYRIKVEENFRGAFPTGQELFSENSSGRFPMAIGHRYLLFAYVEHGRFQVDNCGNSGPLSKRLRELRVVRKLAATSRN
jgi:hypothetical protein